MEDHWKILYRFYIQWFIVLYLTSFTISLSPVLKLLASVNVFQHFYLLSPYWRALIIGDRCLSLKFLNSKVLIHGRGTFVAESWSSKEAGWKISKAKTHFQIFWVIIFLKKISLACNFCFSFIPEYCR